jgi:TP901 family phage tail tape measure protein
MATLTSQLVIELLDRVSAPARRASEAMSGLSRRIREASSTRVSVTDRLDAALARNARALETARLGVADAIGSYYSLQSAIAGPVQAAADFESVMADVAKVVDFPTPEAFAQFQSDLLAMSRNIPFAVEGLGEIAAAAGQAGIAGKDLLRFTEAAAKIGVAFDVSSDYAGGAMANLMTALGLTIDETILLADAMNHLSNNQASSAAEILHVVKNVGAQAKMFGFSAEQTSAFASAMIAAGAQSDVAATSFMNMGKALTRGAAATGSQREAFAQLGLDAEDVAKKMQEDAVGTTVDVLRRISQLPKEQQAAISSQLFGDEARALGPLMTNLDLLMKSLGLVADEAGYAGSSMQEFDAQSGTFNANLQKFRSVIKELQIRLGTALIPALTRLGEVLTPMITKVSELATAYPELTTAVVGAAAAFVAFKGTLAGLRFVGLLSAGGALSMMAKGMTAIRAAGLAASLGCAAFSRGLALLTLSPVIAALRRARTAMIAFGVTSSLLGRGAAFRMLGTSVLAAVNPLRLVRGAMGAAAVGIRALGAALIANPIGLALTGLALAGGFIYRNWSGLQAMWAGFKEGFVSALEPVLPTLEPVIDIVKRVAGAISGLVPELNASSDKWHEWGEGFGEIAASIVNGTAEFFAAGAKIIQSLWDGAVETFNSFIAWVKGIPGRIVDAIGSIDLSSLITFGEPPRWLKWLMGDEETVGPTMPAPPSQAALGALDDDQRAAAETLMAARAAGDLPTPEYLDDLFDYAGQLREEMANVQAQIDQIDQNGPMGDTIAAPLQRDLRQLQEELVSVEAELQTGRERADEVTEALRRLGETEAEPEINTTSIDRALDRVRALRSEMRAVERGVDAPLPATPPLDGARAKGGPVSRGGSYLVGEDGPEVITPSRAGFVHSFDALTQMVKALRAVATLSPVLQDSGPELISPPTEVAVPEVEPIDLPAPDANSLKPSAGSAPVMENGDAVEVTAPLVHAPDVIDVPARGVSAPDALDVPAPELRAPRLLDIPRPTLNGPAVLDVPTPEMRGPETVQFAAPEMNPPDALDVPVPQLQAPEAVDVPAPRVVDPDPVQLETPRVTAPADGNSPETRAPAAPPETSGTTTDQANKIEVHISQITVSPVITTTERVDPAELSQAITAAMRDQVRETFRGVFADTSMRFA